MGWFDGGIACNGDKRYECTYEELRPEDPMYPARWCIDSDEFCWEFDDNGGLVDVKDNSVVGSGGGGW